MTDRRKRKVATDRVTLYAPRCWGGSGTLDDGNAAVGRGGWDPPRFWERILDASRAGLDGTELTFAPGDWQSAMAAYGSAQGFTSALRDGGLDVSSGYVSTRLPGAERQAKFADAADHDLLVEMASAYAEFLGACGSQIMLAALPERRSRDADPPLFVDLTLVESVADVLNRIGYATMKYGVKLTCIPKPSRSCAIAGTSTCSCC